MQLKCGLEALNEELNGVLIIAGEKYIIDIDEHIYNCIIILEDEKGWVNEADRKAPSNPMIGESIVPFLRRLL